MSGDMTSALRGLVGIRNPAERLNAVQSFIAALPVDRIPIVFTEFERMASAGDFRRHQNKARAAASTWEQIVSTVVERGPESFLDLKLGQAGDQASATEFESVLSAWAERDLDAAVAYFDSNIRHLKPEEMQGAAGHLASDFMWLDPEKAVAWLGTLPERVRDVVGPHAVRNLAQEDPQRAAALLASHESLPDRDSLARQVGQLWSGSDPRQAFAWAVQMPTEMAGAALRGVMDQWLESDYDEAVRQISRMDASQVTAALPGLAEKVPDNEVPGLALSLGGPAGDEHQTSAAASLASRWADADAFAASEWLANQATGPVRDSAILGFANRLAQEDPESAFEWVAVIADREARNDALDTGIRDWLDQDPEAARSWVQSSSTLSEADRERLLRRTGR